MACSLVYIRFWGWPKLIPILCLVMLSTFFWHNKFLLFVLQPKDLMLTFKLHQLELCKAVVLYPCRLFRTGVYAMSLPGREVATQLVQHPVSLYRFIRGRYCLPNNIPGGGGNTSYILYVLGFSQSHSFGVKREAWGPPCSDFNKTTTACPFSVSVIIAMPPSLDYICSWISCWGFIKWTTVTWFLARQCWG